MAGTEGIGGMVNTLCLLFSLGAVGFIAVRAAILDKTLPWFKPVPEKAPARAAVRR